MLLSSAQVVLRASLILAFCLLCCLLVYDKTKPASDRVAAAKDMCVSHAPTYVSSSDLTILSSPCIVRRINLTQLDRVCIESINTIDLLVDSDTAEIPTKRLKLLKDRCATVKNTIDNFRKFDVEEEDMLLEKHGFSQIGRVFDACY